MTCLNPLSLIATKCPTAHEHFFTWVKVLKYFHSFTLAEGTKFHWPPIYIVFLARVGDLREVDNWISGLWWETRAASLTRSRGGKLLRKWELGEEETSLRLAGVCRPLPPSHSAFIWIWSWAGSNPEGLTLPGWAVPQFLIPLVAAPHPQYYVGMPRTLGQRKTCKWRKGQVWGEKIRSISNNSK